MTNKTKPMLTRETLYHYVDNKMVKGTPSGLSGDVSGLWGNATGLWGNATGLWGNVTGLRGDVTDLRGNVDDIPLSQRPANIRDYVKK